MIFLFYKKFGFWGILGPPYCGIGASIHVGQEMLSLPNAGFFLIELIFLRFLDIYIFFINLISLYRSERER